MGYSMDLLYADCYEGTTCLINRFDIRDEKKLARLETIITSAKCGVLEKEPIVGDFDFIHYKAIHRFIFEDLYTWAGEIRTVNISKKGTNFVEVKSIERLATNIFSGLKDKNCANTSKAEFINFIVDVYEKTNMLHPFREGNGRTQRVFITQLVRYYGYDINFSNVNTDELMIATIHSANGVKDYLFRVFESAINNKT